jgi:signal transduction histidine kinase
MKLTGFVPTSYFPVLLLMPLPIVLWMTFRFGVRGASAANLAVTAILVSHTLDESSPLAASDIETNVLALQLLLTGLSIPILLLGAAIGQTKSMHSAAAMLVGSILKAQDDERREVARELHDNTGQNLVAATLLLGKLQKGTSHPDALSELTGMLQRSIANLRSMSYGLHPPLLDEAGLPLALQSYVGRLKAGCGFSVDIDLPDDIERLPPEIELAFFRLIQETLDTMSRGADDRRARVLLARGTDARAPNVVLTIESESAETSGTFVSRLINLRHRDSLNGMSLAGVSERIHQLGGVVQLQSAAGRVLVKAVVPLD